MNLRSIRFGSAVCLIVLLLLPAVNNLFAQKAQPERPLDPCAKKAAKSSEPRYSVEYNRHNQRISSRTIIVHLGEDEFDLCNLKAVFVLIARDHPARDVQINAYSDRATLDAMVKFKQNEEGSGVMHFDATPEGVAGGMERLRELGYPETLAGLRAIYQRIERGAEIEQTIDYMPDKDSTKFVRIEF